MTDRLIRLMRIITIVQANPGILARELAERCETSERTIYRDMEALSAMHIPITNMGHGKGYIFISNFALYPLNWTEQEAAAFSMLSVVMDRVKPMLPDGFESAYEKVMASAQKKKVEQANVAQQLTNIIRLGQPSSREDQPYSLMPIILASLTQQTIEVDYYPGQGDDEGLQRIDPYCLIPQDRRFFMLGYCHSQSKVRTFRISRFRSVRILSRTFRKESYDVEHFFRHTWSVRKGQDHTRFIIKFARELAQTIKAEELFVRPILKDLPDGSLLFEVTVNRDSDFLQWLYKFGPGAEIIEPIHYRQRLREMLNMWGTIYADQKAEGTDY